MDTSGYYTPRYETSVVRGYEEARPWNLHDIICQHANEQSLMVDIGCGTAIKILPLATQFQKIIGVEPNPNMRIQAKSNIQATGFENVIILEGKSQNLPIESDSIDVVTAMVAPHDTREVHRILRKGGVAVIEKIGELDKLNFKKEFDLIGRPGRGQFSEFAPGDREIMFRDEFSSLFEHVSVVSGQWRTYFSDESLDAMFQNTPTIRNFDKITDSVALKNIKNEYSTSKGYLTYQHRILITATK